VIASSLKKILFCSIAFSLFGGLAAQDCDSRIVQAEKDYALGNFTAAIDSLIRCNTSNDKNQNWKSYRLLAMSYLAVKETEKARASAKKMLELSPTYKTSSLRDPIELIRLLESFAVLPKWSLGIVIGPGTSLTLPRINKLYSVVEQTKNYQGKWSYAFGIQSAFHLNKNFTLTLGAIANSKSLAIDYSFENWNLMMKERTTYLTIPLGLRYSLLKHNKIRPHVHLGAYYGRYLFGEASFFSTYTQDGRRYSLENFQTNDRRLRHDFGLQGAIGCTFSRGAGQYFVQLAYSRSMRPYTNETARFKYTELQYDYFYIDDDFQLDNLTLTLGYSVYLNYRVK